MRKWKVRAEKDISPSKWFPIKEQVVELPGGLIVDDYFIAPFGDVGMVLPVTRDHKVVLVRQYKHGLGEVILELPAGFRQKGKSVEASAVAELEEETGIKIGLEELIPLGKVSNIPTKTNLVTYGFMAKDLVFNSRQNLDITEQIELELVSPGQVIEMVKSGEIWVADSVSVIMKAYLMFPEIFKI